MENEKLYYQDKNISILLNETLQGEIILDRLPNSSFAFSGESQVMYFSRLGIFLKSTLAADIMNQHMDSEETVLYNTIQQHE